MPNPELFIEVQAADGRIQFTQETAGDGLVKVRLEDPNGVAEVFFRAEETADLDQGVRSIERAAKLAGVSAQP